MLRRTTYIVAIITVCLSWLIPVTVLMRVIQQQAALPEFGCSPAARSQMRELEIYLKQHEEK